MLHVALSTKICPNYSPGVKSGPNLDGEGGGLTRFTLAHVGKIFEISLYLVIRPRFTKFFM